jgi:uncharacterized protein (DUF58 family)
MESSKASLIDPAFLRKLERMRIQARRAFPGKMRGERRSTRRGSSVEFADFRKYEAGDDFRHVDWNIYARLERLMLRQFVEEEDVRIDILIDGSRSMRFGEPVTKFDFARRAAAALAFLAVTSLDRVGLTVFDSSIKAQLRSGNGRGHLVTLLSFLNGLTGAATQDSLVEGQTNLSAVLKAYQKASPRAGILFIISDFFDPADFRKEVKLLAHRGFDVNLIQVLAQEEMNPLEAGDFLLVDSETAQEREVTANSRVVAAYRSALASFTTSLEAFARTSGIGYTLIAADASFEDLLFKNLIESRMVE